MICVFSNGFKLMQPIYCMNQFSGCTLHATRRLHMTSSSSSTDRIERSTVINAPVSRVWRALTNAEEFGGWFGVALKGKNFVRRPAGAGQHHHPGL
jgi:hypothetical protein